MAAKKQKLVRHFESSRVETSGMNEVVDSMKRQVDRMRTNFVRRWYDNNFFDDGYHFRYVERTTNRIVDLTQKRIFPGPVRAIPKASRQIRGIANLLVQSDPTPVVFPEKLTTANYESQQEYQAARQQAKEVAKRVGHWVQEEWKDHHIIEEQLPFMILLAAKHNVSFMQIWPDHTEEKINTRVYDAFDIRLLGNLHSVEDCPFLVKSVPQFISKIQANEYYDEEAKAKLHPDNKLASHELKEAYLSRRFGRESMGEKSSTVILNEAYIKEYLNDENMKRIEKQQDSDLVLRGRKHGDVVIRQAFTAAGVTLRDRYLPFDGFPFVELKLEPGPMYGVPVIERLIPSNKSLDMVVSRLERIIHTMSVGTWLKRRGENFKISNQAGGQVIEYDTTPPVQGDMQSVPNHVFGMIDVLNANIEEQGVTTTTLGKIPQGVKAAKAIESLKESEFANLVMSSRQVRKSIKKITERFLEIAHDYFVTPRTIMLLDKGEPDYFDIIGQTGIEIRQRGNISVPEDAVPVNKNYKVEIEIQSGLGFTREGQLARASELAQFMFNLAQNGLINAQALQVFVKQLLEIYQFGSISELVEAMDQAPPQAMTDEQLQKMKVAMAEVMRDIDKAKGGPQQQQQQRVQEGKVATAEALQDIMQATGADQQGGAPGANT